MRGKTYRKQRKKSTYVSKGTGFKIRSRRKPRQLTEKQKLYRETKKQVDIANKRLRNLEKGGFKNTWASGRLMDRLNVKKLQGKGIIDKRTGKIKINKKLSTTSLIQVNKATRNFIKSKTSTSRGIEDTRKSVIESLQKTYGDKNYDITYEQAEILYNLFDNTDFEDITQYSNASVVWTWTIGYIKKEISTLDYIDRLHRYGNVDYNHDKDLRDKVNDMITYLKYERE